MKAKEILPEGYQEILSIDLQKDKKLAKIVNGLAAIIMVVMGVAMHFVVPISTLFDMSQGIVNYLFRFGGLIVAMIVYMIGHELVHGITMKAYGCKKVNYGFTGMYAFAGSEWYFPKKSYLVIALAPIVVWGVILLILNFLIPAQWFWVVYFIQIMNVSGAAGDLYVTWRFTKLPKDILVKDVGVSMTVYSAQ